MLFSITMAILFQHGLRGGLMLNACSVQVYRACPNREPIGKCVKPTMNYKHRITQKYVNTQIMSAYARFNMKKTYSELQTHDYSILAIFGRL